MIVTLLIVVLLMTVVLVVLLMFVVVILLLILIPTFRTGGALVTTAGAVPIGAGTMIPNRDPGGGGTNTPSGPMGGGPGTTPGPTMASARLRPIAGATNETLGAAQNPPTNTTLGPRWS